MTVEDLEAFGLEPMDDEEIRSFLVAKSVGVLGLPGEGGPVLRPMSYGYDGSALYLRFVLGTDSEKRPQSAASAASFLVYSAETAFNWRSVVVEGTLSVVPESEQDRVAQSVDIAWRPDLLERAAAEIETDLYVLDITDRAGVKHPGLPPGLADPVD